MRLPFGRLVLAAAILCSASFDRSLAGEDRMMKLDARLTPELLKIAEEFFRHDEYSRDSIFDSESPVDFRKDVAGAFVDIDDNGVPEAFFRIDRPDYCGTIGCPFFILKKVGKKWRAICEEWAWSKFLVILARKDHGYHQIVLRPWDDGYHDITTWEHGKCAVHEAWRP